MTHRHLSFQLAYCFKDYTYYDEKCGTAEGNYAEESAGYSVEYKGYASDKTEDESTHEKYLVEYLFDILYCRFAGTDTGDKAALLHEVVGNLYGVKGYGNIEISECDYKNKEEYDVERAVCVKQMLYYVPECLFLECAREVFNDREYCGDEGNDRAREDDGHNAGHVELDREVGVLAAVHLTAYNSLCVLYGDSSFSIGHVSYEDKRTYNDEESENTEYPFEPYLYVFLSLEACDERTCDAGDTGNDIGKEYHGDTAADTLFVDLLAEPHDKCGAGCEACNHYDSFEYDMRAAFVDEAALSEKEEVAYSCDNSESNRHDTCDLVDLSSACFAVFSDLFEFGECYCEKLDNNLRIDIRGYGEREHLGMSERATGENVEISENTVRHNRATCSQVDGCVVNERNRDRNTYAI